MYLLSLLVAVLVGFYLRWKTREVYPCEAFSAVVTHIILRSFFRMVSCPLDLNKYELTIVQFTVLCFSHKGQNKRNRQTCVHAFVKLI